jgi:cell division septal protein FtsQ
MAGRYFYLFSKSNSLLFPRFKIKADILSEIKTVKDADISWKNWQTVDITISEREPHSVWCGNDQAVIGAECFLVDKEGYIYSQAPTFSGSVFIKDYVNISTSTNPIGQYFLPRGIYAQIFNLISTLDSNNLRVVSVFFDGFDFRFTLETGPIIIFNDKNGFKLPFDNLFTAIETKNLDLEKDTLSISYIDLRFDNKIIVGKKGI